jgi:hypothetical protein
MIFLMLDPMFKSFSLMSSFVGKEQRVAIVEEMCQSMEGLVNGKCGKMCSITTKFGGGSKRTLDVYGISVWRLQFEK